MVLLFVKMSFFILLSWSNPNYFHFAPETSCPILRYLVLGALVPPHLPSCLAIPVDAILAVKARFIHLSLTMVKTFCAISTVLTDTPNAAHVISPLNPKLLTKVAYCITLFPLFRMFRISISTVQIFISKYI